MFSSPEFWVGVAFVIFLAIAWRTGAFRSMVSGLDARTNRIRGELGEAKRLREEAATVLADYKRRREEAEREAKAIVASAREEAERAAADAHARLEEFVRRRTASAEAKIAQAEIQATADVRAAAAEAAVRIAETVLRDEMRGPAAGAVLAQGLADVRAKLPN